MALASGSLALLSDAGHMLSDVGAIGGSLWALNLTARPASGVWTFGWKRAEILSAAVNGITLLVVAGIVAFEAIRRLLDPRDLEIDRRRRESHSGAGFTWAEGLPLAITFPAHFCEGTH